MYPPVFSVAAASGDVTALLGLSPTRIYPFGEAPQPPVLPYAVWQLASGTPYNQLAGAPNVDRYTTQQDVYAETPEDARAIAEALRDAFEAVAYVVSWRGESRDPVTRHYRYSFDVEWHDVRTPST